MKIHLTLIVGILLSICYACNKSDSTPDSQASFEELSEKGRALCRNGKYIEGMTMLLAAKDSLAAMPPDSVNPEGAVMLLGNISNMYIRMGMFREAFQTNSQAMQIAETKAVDFLQDLWRMRSTAFELTGQSDSMIYCMRRSIEACKLIPDRQTADRLTTHNRRYLLQSFIEFPDFAPDSVPMALAELERIDSGETSDILFIGRAYVLLGDYERGIPLIERAVERCKEENDIESLEFSMQFLARSYAAAHNPKLFDIFEHENALHDSIIKGRNDIRLLGMDFTHRTAQLENDKKILQNELDTRRLRFIFISSIALIIVVALVFILVMRSRYNKRRLSLKQQYIETLLAERIALNTRIEELNLRAAETDAETKKIELLQTILLEKEDEKRFRKAFNDLHPGFIDRLRGDYPELTAGNELLCMLIALNRRNDEIALTLGISRDSLTTARYRLRNRFKLPKDIDLNDFLRKRL